MVAELMAGGASSWALACSMTKYAKTAAIAMAIANSRGSGSLKYADHRVAP